MKKTVTAILSCLILFFAATDISAIPAFARKYNMSCKTCHAPVPHLKPYGDEFAGNGFVLNDQEAPRYFVETGDPELSLIRDLPIAMRLDGYVTYNENNIEESDFTTPLVFKLLSGGEIAKNFSYYLYYILENGERGKIEDAWIMFNNLFGSELDVTVGQFQVCDPLFKRELRLTRDDYIIYKFQPGSSIVNLTYDRGIMLSYGFETGTDLVAEVVNGSGIGEGFSGRFDNDSYKNLFGRISQDIGEHFRFGAMGYWGKEQRRFDYQLNETWMAGGDATISGSIFELNLQYIKRNDDNPWFINTELFSTPKTETQGGFAELILNPEGMFYGAALFNWVESKNYLETARPYDIYKTLTAHIGYLLKRNVRITGEVTYNLEEEFAKAGIGFMTAF